MEVKYPLIDMTDDDPCLIKNENVVFTMEVNAIDCGDFERIWDYEGRPVRLYRKNDPNSKGFFTWLFGPKKINTAEYISEESNIHELKNEILKNAKRRGIDWDESEVESFGDDIIKLCNYFNIRYY